MTVTKETIAITSLSFKESAVSMRQGDDQSMCQNDDQAPQTLTVYPTDYNETITWTSSNTSVATVSADGQVQALSAGTATITAKAAAASASFTVKVLGTPTITITNGSSANELESGAVIDTSKALAIFWAAGNTSKYNVKMILTSDTPTSGSNTVLDGGYIFNDATTDTSKSFSASQL